MRNSGRDRILQTAIELFGNEGIDDVSISQITRNARVSNSTFYKYFEGKSSLIDEVFKLGVEKLDEGLRVMGFTLESRLTRLMEDYVFFVKENTQICKVLHEAEFTFYSVPKRVKDLLMRKTEEAGLKPTDELFWFLWGPVRFLTMWSFFWKEKTSDSVYVELMNFIRRGIDPNDHVLNERVFDTVAIDMEMDFDTTRSRILASAEKLFSERGFRKTQISDITREAGVGLGTYYLYFETKFDVLRELVKRINSALRFHIKKVLRNFEDRRDAEIAGYHAFLRFFEVHRGVYRIVREAEFVLPESATDYYRRIHDSYLPPLKKAMEENQFLEYDPSSLALFLMGIGHFMGEDLLLVNRRRDFRKALEKLSVFLFKGLGG